MGRTSTWAVRLAAGAVSVGFVLASHVAPVSAQCGGYGCPPTPPQPGTIPDPTCALSSTSIDASAMVRADVRNVPIGTTVELLVAGEPVGSQTGTTPRAGSDPPVADLAFSFTAPSVGGSYEVVAVGPAFQAVCDSGLEVLGVQIARAPASRGRGGALAFTGTEIGLLVALGILLVLVGRWVHLEARRRRRTVAPLQLASTRVRREDAG